LIDSDILLKETIDLLKSLITIPSLSGQEAQAADFLQQRMQNYFSPTAVRRHGHNLIVEIEGERAGPTLLLCSHFDTVGVAKGWTRNPFGAEVDGERIFGLGANDAGASVVSLIAAVRSFHAPKFGRLLLCLAAEEEAGDQGFTKIEPTLTRYNAAIFGEPTGMGVAPAMRGSMRAILRSHGKSCHASRPWEGKNAVDQFVKDVMALRQIDLRDSSPWGSATIEPTVIRGGESTNQIPDMIEATLDIRTTPLKDNDWIVEILKKSGLDINIVTNRRFPMHNDQDSPLMQAIRKVRPAVPNYIFNGSCDMAFAKAPSVVMGPGHSERSHAADEFITVPELSQAIAIYTTVIKEFLSPED
jgi:acetylornithine deacetylase